MAAADPLPPASRVFGLFLGLALAATPGSAIAAPKARLVHCNAQTCLRISGHRSHSAVMVRVAGRDLAVRGNRSWRVTLPLATARDLAGGAGDTLVVTLADARTGAESTEVVLLPPGALGKRIELAALIVRAH